LGAKIIIFYISASVYFFLFWSKNFYEFRRSVTVFRYSLFVNCFFCRLCQELQKKNSPLVTLSFGEGWGEAYRFGTATKNSHSPHKAVAAPGASEKILFF
jgi:hypothetical protein